ncbi:hypothetical protein FHX74_002312 [Friedmanniella endophytica]|uniref:DUF3072 domain-containing protein n=1 Tax=Microlunatus kandeliicorticis TaxID=1759536 RepID=A0A7W3ISZ3_9ACTN|nr:DUF3072 domain-containing protein [Microlunatus kandeliicorticis]MBA8794693.1 hypothetical protein [Microlunatus kandeliicorticis]
MSESPRASVGDESQEPEVLGAPEPESGAQRDPEQWVTGDQPATGPQKSYLDSLARQAGEQISADLTKAEASEHIERLQQKLGVEPS